MRTAVTISLPASLNKEIERGMKRIHIETKSEFFRHVVREWMEKQLLADVKESKRDFEKGNYKELKSMKDLWS